jgi:DNA-dependent RNA polymerase auxiliary subunit epsilon
MNAQPINSQLPVTGVYPPHFEPYIKLITEHDLRQAIADQGREAIEFFNSISEEQSDYAYAEGKWTIKEMLQHLIDSERVFCYRALVFARRDNAALPSFDENEYARNAHGNLRSWKELIEEFDVTRASSAFLFNSFTDEDLAATGIASKSEVAVSALGFTIAGHVRHHINIIKERYLK